MSELHEGREGEKIEKSEVIASLRENSENKELLLRWLDQRQREVEAQNTAAAGLALNIEVAEIYRDAGLTMMAAEAFADAADEAYQLHDDAAYERLLGELEKLDDAEDDASTQ